MIRLFNAYFPTRTLLLTITEAILVTLGFVWQSFSGRELPPTPGSICFT